MTLPRAHTWFPSSRLCRSFLLPSALLCGLGSGCGPEGGGSPELAPFESQADTAVAGLEQDAKSDTPNPNALPVFEIAPGTVVAHDVAPAHPLVGLVFRAEDAAAINANAALRTIPPVVAPPVAPSPPPGGPTDANMAVYRRTSCLGRWERIPNASGTAILATRLPAAGEYLIVTGARNPNTTATLSASFAADQAGKIVDPTRQQPKLAKSWLPAGVMDKLDAAGIDSFSDIRRRGTMAVVRATGLAKDVVEELGKLGPWLDVSFINYPTACALARAGANSPAAYYQMTYAQQQALRSVVPWGSVPLDPGQYQSCVEPESPNVNVAARRPFISWQFYGNGGTAPDHVIGTRPWWTAPTNGPGNKIDPRWFPYAEKGWEIMAYNFGAPTGDEGGLMGNSGPIGYIIANNRLLGLTRLFVYLPSNEGYNNLVANVAVTDQYGGKHTSWDFPLLDVPTADAENGAATMVWNHTGRPFEDLSYGGRWVRTELPTLFDPRVYPGRRASADDLRQITLRFYGLQVGQADLYANLDLELSGSAVPSSPGGTSSITVVKGAFTTGISGAAGAATVSGYIGLSSTGGGLIAVGAAGLAGAFLGIFGSDSQSLPEYRINLAGAGKGTVSGQTTSVRLLTTLHFFLSGTYRPIRIVPTGGGGDADGGSGWRPGVTRYMPGGIAAYQRCERSRLGTIGFQGATAGAGNDPRPERIPVQTNRCNLAERKQIVIGSGPECNFDSPVESEAEVQLGAIRRSPSAPIYLDNTRVEIQAFFPPVPRIEGSADQPHLRPARIVQGGTRPLNVAGVQRMPALTLEEADWEKIRRGEGKIYLRYHATLTPRDESPWPSTLKPDEHRWEYALDVTSRIVNQESWSHCAWRNPLGPDELSPDRLPRGDYCTQH